MTGSRALFRWVWRVIRAEWRQHILVISMIAFGVAIATLLVSSLTRLQVPDARYYFDAPATVEIAVASDDPAVSTLLEESVTALLATYPDTELQAEGRSGPEGVQMRGAEPLAPLGGVNFSLLEGSWPAAGEVALTSSAVDLLSEVFEVPVEIGQTRSIGNAERLIVGIWENPNNLDSRMALVPPSEVEWERAQILLPSRDHSSIDDYLTVAGPSDSVDPNATLYSYLDSPSFVSGGADSTVIAYLGGTILSFQIAILASAGFTVLAQRRTRQLGMLSAMGASPRQLGSVMWLTGLICGVFGGIIGLVSGVLLSMASTPLVQLAVNHRLRALDLPWALLIPILPLAIITAMLAAWWPARRVRKTSTVDAISARRPPQTKVTRSFVVGVVLLGLGAWLLVEGGPRNSPPWVVGGASSLVIGALLLVPGVVSLLGAAAGRTALPIRIAWRDINRNRSRTSAAVAAAAIAIAIPFGLASFVASLSGAYVPYRPDNVMSVSSSANDYGQLKVEDGPAAFAPLTDMAPGARLVPVQLPVDREMTALFSDGDANADPSVPEYLATFNINMIRRSGVQGTTVAFATPELIEAMGIEPPAADTNLLAFVESELDLEGRTSRPDIFVDGDGASPNRPVDGAADLSNLVVERRSAVPEVFPQILIVGDLDGISRDDVVVYEWLLVQDAPYTDDQILDIEGFANRGSDFRVGVPDGDPPFKVIRASALLAAGLLGMSVVAVSVALIRVENENDARALNAVGASPRVSRAIGAATAAGLVLVAVAVAVPTSFLALIGVYLNPDEAFDFAVPWIELGVVAVLLPLIAAVGGWLLTTSKTSRMLS